MTTQAKQSGTTLADHRRSHAQTTAAQLAALLALRHPGTDFGCSVKQDADGYCATLTVHWTDGPTAEHIKRVTDKFTAKRTGPPVKYWGQKHLQYYDMTTGRYVLHNHDDPHPDDPDNCLFIPTYPPFDFVKLDHHIPAEHGEKGE